MRGTRTVIRTWMAVIAAAGTALAVPAVAGAADGTVGETGTTLTYQDAPGRVQNLNVFHVDRPAGPYRVNTGFEAIAGTGCRVVSVPTRQTFDCTSAGMTRIVMLMGDLNDKVNLSNVTIASRINGGAGGDDLTGGEGPDSILGGLGVNLARGMAGNDRLSMRNGKRDTLIDCGAGIDTAVVDKIDPRPIACETVLRPR